MRRIAIGFLLVGFLATLFIFMNYAVALFRGQGQLSFDSAPVKNETYRIIYISEELGTPFWDAVKQGADEAAPVHHAAVDFLGAFRPNPNELVKYMEIAIASKVDGIVVQGEDTTELNAAIEKAFTKGIPVMTISTDAPNSLRRSYIGSNHYSEGTMIAGQVVAELHAKGTVALVAGHPLSNFEKARLKGFRDVIGRFPDIRIVEHFSGSDSNPLVETREILNRYPNCKTFVLLSADAGSGVIHTISARAKISDYAIFGFDDNPEMLQLLHQGLLLATLRHQPEQMGRTSLDLIVQWLEGRNLPLKTSYDVPIRLLQGNDRK